VTVRHLLNHTSGLPTSSGEVQLADFDDHPDATERQARALSTLELNRPVGAAWEYSNANYSLLGLIIEAASGEAYSDYVQNHVFTPLEMRHTYTSRAEAERNGVAVGHQYWFSMPFAAPDMPIPQGSLPAAGLISTSEDMARYLLALLNESRRGDAQVLSGAGVDELHRGAADIRTMGFGVASCSPASSPPRGGLASSPGCCAPSCSSRLFRPSASSPHCGGCAAGALIPGTDRAVHAIGSFTSCFR
jgi:CubicO group peptidase (beta-lactamase class C family)